ncbi:MAG: hypothetical protein GX488_01560 [Clostridiales bacterium]|nr:hypothetical protein [Clostridiales bacterium]
MKLLIIITSRSEAPAVVSAMSKEGYQSTILNSTGGFLKEDNTVILSGVDDAKVSKVMKLVQENTTEGVYDVPPDVSFGNFKLPKHIKKGRAVVFILDAEQFVRL